MIKYRMLEETDNLDQICDWIYQTDKFLFNRLFVNDKKRAISGIKKLIDSPIINPYHRKFFLVAYDDVYQNDIQGIAISFKGSDITLKEELKAIRETGYSNLGSILEKPVIDYFLASSIKRNDYYIGNLYVNPKYRKNKIGSKLVKECINKARELNCDNVLLDVEYKKENLPKFYEKLGFKKDSKNYLRFFGKVYGCHGMKYIL